MDRIDDAELEKRIQAYLEQEKEEFFTKPLHEALEKKDLESLRDAFSTSLVFGTAGLRGRLGGGFNRMNFWVIQKTSLGVGNYFLRFHPAGKVRMVVGYDSRQYSKEFAQLSARIFASLGIEVSLFSVLSPTPLVSFAVRFLEAQGGIMITASHNPPQYNGYKVYWSNGAQISFEHDQALLKEIEEPVSSLGALESLEFYEAQGRIQWIGEGMLEEYIQAVLNELPWKEFFKRSSLESPFLKVVYTALHGVGGEAVRQIFERFSYPFFPVEAQMIPDPLFSTARSVNPEEKESFERALERAREVGADLIFATDPDADRLGVMVLKSSSETSALSSAHQEEYVSLTGNQIGAILLFSLLQKIQEKKEGNSEDYTLQSIVSTPLTKEIAQKFGIRSLSTLTGFKWMAYEMEKQSQELVRLGKSGRMLFAFEESIGYLPVSFLRDKDGISSLFFLLGKALELKQQGKNLLDYLTSIYAHLGVVYHEKTLNFFFEGLKGLEEMKSKMHYLRQEWRSLFAPLGEMVRMKDYQESLCFSQGGFQAEKFQSYPSDVLEFEYTDFSFILRPSGTEPKLKLYLFTWERFPSSFELTPHHLVDLQEKLEKRMERVRLFLEKLLFS